MYTGEPYALPLEDLIQVLQTASGKTYLLRATLPASRLPFPTKRGESFLAEVIVTAGRMSSCVIRVNGGPIRVEGSMAFDYVRTREQLDWTVQQLTDQDPVPPAFFPSESAQLAAMSSFPQVILPWAARPPPVKRQGETTAPAHLTRRQRQIWLLVDGRRTIHEIAPLLGTPLDVLDEELTVLERKGLITAGRIQQERR
jgi:hypothetical protein